MRHLDLFTGIGGFALAAQNVWGKDYEPIAFCEIDKFCQKVLKKHWPDVEIINDVKDDRIKQFRDIDLLTAGVPCQPTSVAGKKRGTSDERWLWSETLAVLNEVRPRWAILENVPGLLTIERGIAFNRIRAELARCGYDCWKEPISACAVGAPHKRIRIWIVAYNANNGCTYRRTLEQGRQGILCEVGTTKKNKSFRKERERIVRTLNADVANTIESRARRENKKITNERRRTSQNRSTSIRQTNRSVGTSGTDTADRNVANAEKLRCGRWGNNGCKNRRQVLVQGKQARNQVGSETERCSGSGWQENWIEVATHLCRVANGVPNRVDRLKSLGNAIVPQVAMVIMQAIKEIDEQR